MLIDVYVFIRKLFGFCTWLFVILFVSDCLCLCNEEKKSIRANRDVL